MEKQLKQSRMLIRKRDIIPYVNEGYTAGMIGKVFSLSIPTIKRYMIDLREAGYDVPKRKAGRRRIPN